MLQEIEPDLYFCVCWGIVEEEVVRHEAVRIVVRVGWVTNFRSELKFHVSYLPGGNSCSRWKSIIWGILIFLKWWKMGKYNGFRKKIHMTNNFQHKHLINKSKMHLNYYTIRLGLFQCITWFPDWKVLRAHYGNLTKEPDCSLKYPGFRYRLGIYSKICTHNWSVQLNYIACNGLQAMKVFNCRKKLKQKVLMLLTWRVKENLSCTV